MTGPDNSIELQLKEETENPSHTIFSMILEQFPSVFATQVNIIIEFVPKGQCRKSRTWNVCNGRQIQSPYRTVESVPC